MIKRNSKIAGFSIIELMVVVAIIGLLSVIASISYDSYAKRGHRTAAKSNMVDIANRLERHYTEENTYDGFEIPSGLNRIPESGSQTLYTISLELDGDSFELSATPSGTQSDDDCGVLTLDNVGRKSAEQSVDCW